MDDGNDNGDLDNPDVIEAIFSLDYHLKLGRIQRFVFFLYKLR
jgi:hypothetical protein